MFIEIKGNHSETKWLIIGSAVFVLCGLFVYGLRAGWYAGLFQMSRADNPVIGITKDGFEPERLVIDVGTTVLFENRDSKSRWPASDLHPTHEEYSEFDPKQGIPPGESWEFTFGRAGEWGYHDHLIPHQKGVIVVGKQSEEVSGALPEEIANLKDITDTKKQADIVRRAAEKYGPRETLSFMNRSGLPYTGETHLLVHEIGNVAYKKFADEALLYCDDSFLSACYHGVILNALGDNGMNGVLSLMERCRAAGQHVISQCSHAAGHGFLAFVDYKVLEALPYCDKLVEGRPYIPEFNCHDGVFMENIFGVHEGKPSPNRMVKQDDLEYPCNAVPEKYQGGCWANQATLMYQLLGGNYAKVAGRCDSVKNTEHQRICYHNFARQIHPETQGKTDRAVALCTFATGQRWQDQCLITLVEAAFSVGDRRQMPYELCAHTQLPEKRDECYTTLVQRIGSYAKSPEQRKEWCSLVPEASFKERCYVGA